jgi:hypothetical protein
MAADAAEAIAIFVRRSAAERLLYERRLRDPPPIFSKAMLPSAMNSRASTHSNAKPGKSTYAGSSLRRPPTTKN